jgi:hypothetical protein
VAKLWKNNSETPVEDGSIRVARATVPRDVALIYLTIGEHDLVIPKAEWQKVTEIVNELLEGCKCGCGDSCSTQTV